CDLHSSDSFRISMFREITGSASESCDLLKRMRLPAPVGEIGRCWRQLVEAKIEGRIVSPKHHDAICRRIGQGLQEDRDHHAENGSVPPDAQGKGEQGYGGKARVLEELAKGKLHGFAILDLRFAILACEFTDITAASRLSASRREIANRKSKIANP